MNEFFPFASQMMSDPYGPGGFRRRISQLPQRIEERTGRPLNMGRVGDFARGVVGEAAFGVPGLLGDLAPVVMATTPLGFMPEMRQGAEDIAQRFGAAGLSRMAGMPISDEFYDEQGQFRDEMLGRLVSPSALLTKPFDAIQAGGQAFRRMAPTPQAVTPEGVSMPMAAPEMPQVSPMAAQEPPSQGLLDFGGSPQPEPLLGSVEAHPNRIATRLPTAVKATEDPVAQPLQIGLQESKVDPKAFSHNVGIVQRYPNMTEAQANMAPEEASEAFIEHVKDNLLWMHDSVPADTRQRSKLWYDGARAITDSWVDRYGVPDASIAGVLAALSPQKDWYQNVSLGERVLDTLQVTDVPVDAKMMDFARSRMMKTPAAAKKFGPLLDDFEGKTLADLETPLERAIYVRLFDETRNPRDYKIVGPEGDFLQTATTTSGAPQKVAWGSAVEIEKAVRSAESGGDKAILTPLMGTQHKVRSFYNNILDPNGPAGDVTIDTHAVAAGLLRPLSGNSTEVHHNFGSAPAKAKQGEDWFGATKNSAVTGVQGNYGLYAEAYRRAAQERGVLPREMQSITWEAARGLFTDTFKRDKKAIADINSIWQKYRQGEITVDEARNAVERRAGGINPPSWQQ